MLKEVDLKKLSKAYLTREINVLNDTYKYLGTLNLDSYFSVLKYSPGIEEYALLSSIEEISAGRLRIRLYYFRYPADRADLAVSGPAPGHGHLDRPTDSDPQADSGKIIHHPADQGTSKQGKNDFVV